MFRLKNILFFNKLCTFGDSIQMTSLSRSRNWNIHCVKSAKYGVFSGPYFSVFRLNTEKYGPEKTPYFDTFYAVINITNLPEC